jgi:hypothetical protein
MASSLLVRNRRSPSPTEMPCRSAAVRRRSRFLPRRTDCQCRKPNTTASSEWPLPGSHLSTIDARSWPLAACRSISQQSRQEAKLGANCTLISVLGNLALTFHCLRPGRLLPRFPLMYQHRLPFLSLRVPTVRHGSAPIVCLVDFRFPARAMKAARC